MTDGPGSIHLLRPSIPDTVPPLPARDGTTLKIALGYAVEDSAGRRARIYTRPRSASEHAAAQHGDLHEGDVFECSSWRFEVLTIDRERGVRLRLLPGDPDG